MELDYRTRLQSYITECWYWMILQNYMTELYYRSIVRNHTTEVCYGITWWNDITDCSTELYNGNIFPFRGIILRNLITEV